MNPNAPHSVLAAVQRIYDVLPNLVGTDWSSIQPQVDAHIATLQTQPDAYLASAQLFGLLARYEPARLRLSEELIVQQTVAANLSGPLAEIKLSMDDTLLAVMMSGFVWEVDSSTVPPLDESLKTVRAIAMKDGGADGAKSIKFKNLDLDLGKMMTVGAGFFLAGQDMLDKPTPFMIAGGILVLVGTLLSEMTVKIEQQEATVFWGFIVATNEHPKDRQASVDAIFTTTNAERRKRGLPDLTDEQLKHSLYKLEQLGSVERVEGDRYRIIEKFKVKG